MGLCYRQHGHHAAVHLGLQLVGPKMAELAQSGLEAAVDGNIALLSAGRKALSVDGMVVDPNRVDRLSVEGGYKSFRVWVGKHCSNLEIFCC